MTTMTRGRHDGRARTMGRPGARRAVFAGLVAAAMALGSAGCAKAASDGGDEAAATDATGEVTGAGTTAKLLSSAEIPTDGSPLALIDTTDLWSKRDADGSYDESEATTIALDGSSATAAGKSAQSVSVGDGTVTISTGGTYVLSGSSSGLTVTVDAGDDEKVQLVLDGTEMERDGYACIYAKSADKVFLTVADGTKSSLSSTGEFAQSDDSNVDGAVFAKCDLTINGGGSLSVSCAEGHGIVGKDDVRLVSADTAVTAPKGHAIQANDSIAVRDGKWELSAGKDAMHCENADDAAKGWVYVAGGTLSLTATTDGIDSSSRVQINDGTITASCGDDGIHAEFDLAINGGKIDVTRCEEGIEGGTVTLTAGDVSVVAHDDGLNATGEPGDDTGKTDGELLGHDGSRGAMGTNAASDANDLGEGDAQGGTNKTEGATGDGQEGQRQRPQGNPPAKPSGEQGGDGQESGGFAQFDGQTPPQPHEMPDGQGSETGNGERPETGEPPATPSDDQQGTDSDGSGMPTPPGGGQGGFGMMGSDDTAILTIAGGSLTVESGGDGLDSNGAINVTGGTTYVWGPTSNGDSPVDYGTKLLTGGGTLVAVGSSGMTESVSDESGQASLAVFLEQSREGNLSVSLDGNEIVSCSPKKAYAYVLVSTPEMTGSGTYDVKAGDESVTVEASGTVTEHGSRQTSGWGRPILEQGEDGELVEPSSLIGRKGSTQAQDDGEA